MTTPSDLEGHVELSVPVLVRGQMVFMAPNSTEAFLFWNQKQVFGRCGFVWLYFGIQRLPHVQYQ
jgi:hypothetical protein